METYRQAQAREYPRGIPGLHIGYEPDFGDAQLSCGSLRHHEAHIWRGQTFGAYHICPGRVLLGANA
jgi:hypothetical protein